MLTIRVLFSCFACGLMKSAVDVPARAPGADLGEWMGATMLLVGKAHSERSPGCACRRVDLMIPMDASTPAVGAPSVN